MKAILTGHTRGLGAAMAASLLSRGIPVLGLARGRNAELGKRFPTGLEQVELDLSDCVCVARWLAAGSLHRFLSGCKSVVLVNNAGVLQPIGSIETQDVFMIAQAVSVNVAAPIMLASAVAAATPDASDRRILHVSSGAGRSPFPGLSVYCATKAALDHHARAVACDQKPGWRVCSLAPGMVDTDMQAEIRGTTLEQFPLRGQFEAFKQTGALSSPEATASRLVDYLLSDEFGQVQVADVHDL